MKKIGILGGTFNPIHHGHLILGQAAKEEFGLDEILVMPTKNPAYKKISGGVSEKNRVDTMADILVATSNDSRSALDAQIDYLE